MALPEISSFPQSGSIAHAWKLDEASGTRADSVGSANLTDNNTVTTVAGQFDTDCASFDDANSEYLSAADRDSLSYMGSSDRSFALWVYFDDTTGVNSLFGKWVASQEYLLYANGTTLTFGALAQGAVLTHSITAGQWYRVCITMDSSKNYAMYVNGSSVSTATGTGSIATTNDALQVGANSTSNFFDGAMQYIVFWTAKLTPEEAQEDYDAFFAPTGGFMTLNSKFW